MANYTNFYETVKEAMMRLRSTIVLYDGEPYQVLVITDHKKDGIFRIYLAPIQDERQEFPEHQQYHPESVDIGPYMDKWMEDHPNSKIIRKQMNSPLFNKFRPFPLGMCNVPGEGVFYIERQPNRKTEQGIISSMLDETLITTAPPMGKLSKSRYVGGAVSCYGSAFRACVMAEHPTAEECLVNLLDPEIVNTAAAFHRHFALARGPLNMLFLAYKTDIVGILPRNDFSQVRIGKDFRHTREVIEELKLFQSII